MGTEARILSGARRGGGRARAAARAAALVLALAASGCQAVAPVATTTPTNGAPVALPPSPRPPTPTAPATPGLPAPSATVTVWLAWEADDLAALRRLLQVFMADHPEVGVRLVYYPPAELHAAYRAAAGRPDGPTVVIGPSEWGVPLWQDGLTQDLAGLLAPGVRQGLFPVSLSLVTYGEIALGVPLSLEGVVLYANRDLMPETAARVEDLVALPANPDQDPPPPGVPDFGFRFIGSWLSACQGEWLDVRARPAFDTAGGACWLELLRVLAPEGAFVQNSDDDRQRFEAGQAPWLIDGTWNLPHLAAALDPQSLAIDAWPVHRPTSLPLAGFTWTENAYVTSGLPPADLEAAWELLRFLAAPDAQTVLADPLGAARLPVAREAVVADRLMAEALRAITRGVPYPLPGEIALFAEPLEQAARTYIRQGLEADYLLERARERIEMAQAAAP